MHQGLKERDLGGGVVMAIGKYNMRNLHYKNRTIRISDQVWEDFKLLNKESGKSWNLFIKGLIKSQKNDTKQEK